MTASTKDLQSLVYCNRRKLVEYIAVALKEGESTIRSFDRRDNSRIDRQENQQQGNFARSKFIPLHLLTPSLPSPKRMQQFQISIALNLTSEPFLQFVFPLVDTDVPLVSCQHLDHFWIGIAISSQHHGLISCLYFEFENAMTRHLSGGMQAHVARSVQEMWALHLGTCESRRS